MNVQCIVVSGEVSDSHQRGLEFNTLAAVSLIDAPEVRTVQPHLQVVGLLGVYLQCTHVSVLF